MDNPLFSVLKPQFEAIDLPAALYDMAVEKIANDFIDAGNFVVFAEIASSANDEENDENEGENEDDVDLDDFNKDDRLALVAKSDMKANETVFIVDHIWLTTFPQSIHQLQDNEVLRERIGSMIGFDLSSEEDVPLESKVKSLWTKIWRDMECFDSPRDDYTKWFMKDEVGCAFRHSSSPNFICRPIVISLNNNSYTLSLAWPIEDIEEGDMLTRDYFNFRYNTEDTAILRSLQTIGYFDESDDLNRIRSILNFTENAIPNTDYLPMQQTQFECPPMPSWDAITEKIRNKVASGEQIKIFCDRSDHVNSNMIHDSRLKLVDSAEEADILYLIDHTYDGPDGSACEYFKAGKLLNQFWWEGMIVTKDRLCRTVKVATDMYKKCSDSNDHTVDKFVSFSNQPAWYPITYDLANAVELWTFVQDFLRRRDSNGTINNTWIMKRYQGKQSVDYPITENLSCAVRHLDSCPRLASKYVSNPALLLDKKFDLRFYVLVMSLEPLVLLRHKMFIIRWSNHAYSDSDYDDYQKHFTVMNFLDDQELQQVRGAGKRCDISKDDFVKLFNSTHGPEELKWENVVLPRVDETLKEVFGAVKSAFNVEAAHPTGAQIHPNAAWSLNQPNITTAHAMYGVDILLDSSYQPVVMEVQWAPDCAKAVELMPNFWDTMLGALFLGDREHVVAV